MWVRSIFLFLLCCSSSIRAQYCFTVTDQATFNPVFGCQIYDGTGAPLAVSDLDGRFCLSAPLPTALILQAPGYHAVRVELEDLEDDLIRLDPMVVDLPEVRITPDPRRSLGMAMITAMEADSALLWNFERSGINSAMQWVPGVQMDQRGLGGSARLSIRGSLLRSPFGVRGVKVYWSGLPLTLADGSTPLELLDPELIGSMQVVRSVGPPAYGSAPSGLLLTTPPTPFTGRGAGVRASVAGGSYGFHRISLGGSFGNAGNNVVVGALRQRNEGYRDQEYSRRDQVFIVSRHQRRRTTIQLLLTLQEVAWGLPGGLDSLTAADAPRTANAFSRKIDARLEKLQLFGGVVAEHRFSSRYSLLFTLHGHHIDKLNPFGTSPVFSGYKEELIGAAGSRQAIAAEFPVGRWKLSATIGNEVLVQRDLLDERVIIDAVPSDSFRTRADTRVITFTPFAELRSTGPANTSVYAGIGMERNVYQHEDRLLQSLATVDRLFDPRLVAGVSQRLFTRWWISLRHGASVSRPTVWELLGSDGRFLEGLMPESVRETELALTHGASGDRLQMQVAAYMRRVEGLILPMPSSEGTGNVFANAGVADQNGLEAYMVWRPDHGERLPSITAMLTIQEHVVDRDHGDAHRIPGVPPVTAGTFVRQPLPAGLSIQLGMRHVAAIPVGPLAEERLPAHQIWHARMEWQGIMGSRGTLVAFIHVEDVFDAGPSSFVQATDPLGRYHNPTAGRVVLGGMRWEGVLSSGR